MKYTMMILLTFTLLKGCSQGSKDLPPESVRYTASSRGYYFEIMATPEFILVKKDRGSESYQRIQMPPKEWEGIIESIKDIDVTTLGTLKTETEKSAADKVAIADLSIVYDSSEYVSNPFDEGSPPKAIESLVNKLLVLAESVE